MSNYTARFCIDVITYPRLYDFIWCLFDFSPPGDACMADGQFYMTALFHKPHKFLECLNHGLSSIRIESMALH